MNKKDIALRIEIFREGNQYVSLCPELNVSSFGNTIIEARNAIKEAIELFLEECKEMDTLEEVLEESGFKHITRPEEKWVSREPVAIENINCSLLVEA